MSTKPTIVVETRLLYERPDRQLLAALRTLRTAPGPENPSEERVLRAAARKIGRSVVEVHAGQILLGWDADTNGTWGGEGMDSVRSARPAQPRLLRTLAACLRCCWTDPNAPIYPAELASVDDVLATVNFLRAPNETGGTNVGGTRHARGALTTLDFAGLIVLNQAEQTIMLGPVVAAWPDHEVSVLRGVWSRLPRPPAERVTRISDGFGESK